MVNKCAPVLIPTLCRYEHFKECIESLKKNSYAQYTDIFIALDYPLKDAHKSGYEKICEYLKNDFSEFKSFNVEKRKYNYGCTKNSLVRKIDNGPALIEKWLRNKNTIEFLGIWEEMYNEDFDTNAYDEIM